MTCPHATTGCWTNLKCLELHAIVYSDAERKYPHGPLSGTSKALQQVISSAPILETPRLSCVHENSQVPLMTILESNQLSRLRHLDLSNMTVTQQELVGCLITCAATMKDLRLDRIHLIEGSWLEVFDNLEGMFQMPLSSESGSDDSRNGQGWTVSLSWFVQRGTGTRLERGFNPPGVQNNHGVMAWFCGQGDSNPYWQHFEVWNGSGIYWNYDFDPLAFAMNGSARMWNKVVRR